MRILSFASKISRFYSKERRVNDRFQKSTAQPILNYPASRNIKQLRRFLDMSSWYRRFIPQFATVSTLSEPLTRLLKKNKRWEWTDEQSHAFEQIRSHLVAAYTLSCPDFKVPFVTFTNGREFRRGKSCTYTEH